MFSELRMVILHQLSGQTHRVLYVHVVILGAVYHHQGSVPHIMTGSGQAGPDHDISDIYLPICSYLM